MKKIAYAYPRLRIGPNVMVTQYIWYFKNLSVFFNGLPLSVMQKLHLLTSMGHQIGTLRR